MTNETKPSKNTRRFRWRMAGIGVAVLFVIFFILHSPRTHAIEKITPPTVAVVRVVRENLARDLTFDAEFKPYQEIDLHAKVAGYLEEIPVDVGDRVKAGQRIARLEVPELEIDLEHARAVEKRAAQDVKKAEAVYNETHLAYGRLQAVVKTQPHLVAQQELDTAQSKDLSAEAGLGSARLAVEEARSLAHKLETMLGFRDIIAPFAGVITRRYADPGALIQAGTASSTQALPLVRLSQMDKLRLTFPISMSFVDKIHVNDPVEIIVQNGATPLFAKVARVTSKVEMATRTMDAEVDVPNPEFKIIPGTYASVILHVDQREKVLTIPMEALSQGKTPVVYAVNSKSEIEERAVKIGLRTPRKAEVLSGLGEDEFVMIGTRSRIQPGQKVEPKVVQTLSLE